MVEDLEALAVLRANICTLWPPGPVRDRWLAWADDLVLAPTVAVALRSLLAV